jgi:hypothetical protein
MRPIRAAIPLVAVLACGAALGAATTAESNAPSQEYLDQKAELEQMINSRDMELYEMSFEPLAMDRVVLTTRSGKEAVFNYLTFRLRNQIADKTSTPLSQAKGYNDVLAAMQEQYAGMVKKVEDNGVKLQIEGVDGQDGTIVERQNAQIHQKKVSITVYGYDENGTRIRLLDEPPGSGAQESFNFPDIGEPSWAAVAEKVKDKIEEKEGRELWSLDKIRGIELPPFESSQIEKNGWAKGELYGVAMFHRLSDYGDFFTFQVRGLSNKFRIHWPDTEAGKVENYLDARFFRRVWTLHYERLGDEYFRDLDPFVLKKSGWEWVNTFQRNEQRRSMAYARYFLENIANTSTPSPTANQTVESEFWPYYGQVRQEHPAKPNAPVPDLEAELKSPGGR